LIRTPSIPRSLSRGCLIQELVTAKTPDKYWRGSFEFPPSSTTESFPSVFGTRRSYNGEGYFKYHNGLDFFGGTGVPILAPAPGRVVFAGPLDVRGNATYIDHGWGIYTGYLHQSEILVDVGQMVEAGEEIGLVGATGRVTGPHLHWEMWVGGVRSILWPGSRGAIPRRAEPASPAKPNQLAGATESPGGETSPRR